MAKSKKKARISNDIDAKADAILGKTRGKVHTGPVHTFSSKANGGRKK